MTNINNKFSIKFIYTTTSSDFYLAQFWFMAVINAMIYIMKVRSLALK